MTIVKRWNTKTFSRNNIEKVKEVVGVYLLLTDAEYINYVGYSSNLYRALLRHFDNREIPTRKFMVYQTTTLAAAKKLKKRLIEDNEPYYNLLK